MLRTGRRVRGVITNRSGEFDGYYSGLGVCRNDIRGTTGGVGKPARAAGERDGSRGLRGMRDKAKDVVATGRGFDKAVIEACVNELRKEYPGLRISIQ